MGLTVKDIKDLQKELVRAIRCIQPGNGTIEDPVHIMDRCLCDDVAGDGSVVVNFVRFFELDTTTGAISQIGDYRSDLSGPYVPQGTIRQCSEIGQTVFLNQGRVVLQGPAVWVRPDLVESVTVKVYRVTDPGQPPLVTDYTTTTTPLMVGDVETWSIQGDMPALQALTGTFQVETFGANDYVVILWTQLQ